MNDEELFNEYWIRRIGKKNLNNLLCSIDYDGYIMPEFLEKLKKTISIYKSIYNINIR